MLSWAARNGPALNAGSVAGAILLTPLNRQQGTTEVGVADHPELGARYQRAPGSISGAVTLYMCGADGQPARDGLTLAMDARGQLTGPAGTVIAGLLFGTLPVGAVDGGVQLAPGLLAVLSAQSSGIETRTQEEADLVATLQAQGKTTSEIQAALDSLRISKIGDAVQNAINSPDPDISLEGQVASALRNAGVELTGFQKKVRPNGSVAEIDVETKSVVIEVTNQRRGKLSQIEKKINPTSKKVVYMLQVIQNSAKDINSIGRTVIHNFPDLISFINALLQLGVGKSSPPKWLLRG